LSTCASFWTFALSSPGTARKQRSRGVDSMEVPSSALAGSRTRPSVSSSPALKANGAGLAPVSLTKSSPLLAFLSASSAASSGPRGGGGQSAGRPGDYLPFFTSRNESMTMDWSTLP
jgi:hypothetical protein